VFRHCGRGGVTTNIMQTDRHPGHVIGDSLACGTRVIKEETVDSTETEVA
jgi:hypothetical protein